MQICIVAQSASRLGYGLFPVLTGTSRALLDLGHSPSVVAGRDARSASDRREWGPVPVRVLPLMPPRNLHYAPGLNGWLRRHTPIDVMSLHVVWMAMHSTALHHAKRNKIPSIMMPHGSLDPWALALSKTKKKVARLLYTDQVLHGVDCFHALNEDEALAIRQLGLRAPIAVVRNGVDIPGRIATRARSTPRTLLFMGRLHAKKGIRELVAAWRVLSLEFPDWELVVAGPDEQQLTSELQRGSDLPSVRFVGEVRGEDKQRLFTEAHAFILPSFSEGLPMTVLEAWSYALPVVMSRECNVPEGFERLAAVEVRPTVESIVATLRSFLRRPAAELDAMGDRGRELVLGDFSWTRVGSELASVYSWLRGQADRPASVHLD